MTARRTTAGPSVATIVPCYNSARFVGDALRSVLAQRYQPIEIVVVDDGSTDDLWTALQPFRRHIRLVSRENGGPSAARNTGIDASNSELISFLDPDDRWHPDKIQRQVAYVQAHPDCGVVATGRRAIDGDGRILPMPGWWSRTGLVTEDPLIALLPNCSIMSSQILLRRSVLGADRFVPQATPVEDWDLWLRLAERTRFGALEEPLTDYRKHENNLSRDRVRLKSAVVVMLDRAIVRLPLGEAQSVALEARAAVLSGLI